MLRYSNMKRTKQISNLILLTGVFSIVSLLGISCDRFEGDQTVPAYLTIDDISVVNDPVASWSYYQGFFSSDIESVNVEIYFEGDTAVTNLGAYQLPCKVPVLRQGTAKYVDVTPVVKQNGIASTRIRYPYYRNIKIDDVRLTPDSVTSLGSLTTQYSSYTTVAWKEFFEPQAFNFLLDPDSVIRAVSDLDTVCSDYGCGAIHVRKDQKAVNFWIDEPMEWYDKTAYTYLELDYMSDISFSIGFNNPNGVATSNIVSSAEVLYPSDHWQKVYINLGKLWADTYYYYPFIRLYFTALNESGKEGNIYLDNMKVVLL